MLRLIPPHHMERCEAPDNQPLRVERNLTRDIKHPVGMHPLLGRIEALLVGPDLPGEDDLLALLRGDRLAEVGALSLGDALPPQLRVQFSAATVSTALSIASIALVPAGTSLAKIEKVSVRPLLVII